MPREGKSARGNSPRPNAAGFRDAPDPINSGIGLWPAALVTAERQVDSPGTWPIPFQQCTAFEGDDLIRPLLNSAMKMIPWWLRTRIRRIPALAMLQRKIVSATLDDSTFVHQVSAGPAKGVRFLITMPEDKGIWTGTYESDFALLVAQSVRPGMVAFDIGGWHGFFAGVMGANGARCVHIFEPLPTNIERLEKMIELNPQLPMTLHRCALGETRGETELLIMPETSMAKLAASPFRKDSAHGASRKVRLETIDGLVDRGEAPPPDIIKMDIEGAELMALRGAVDILRRHKPLLLAEFHSRSLYLQCSEMLRSEGYRIDLLNVCGPEAGEDAVFQVRADAS